MKKLMLWALLLALLTGCGAPAAQPQAQTPATQPPAAAEGTQPAEDVPAGNTCTLTIRCDNLIGNTDLDPEKAELIPADGVLFTISGVEIFPDETVFNVLQRAMKQNKQHLEFVQTPIYNSAYIEGICNLYAFDAGDLSGWMYAVNETFPNFGCSQYKVQPGDHITWHYTCDLGADLGAAGLEGNN